MVKHEEKKNKTKSQIQEEKMTEKKQNVVEKTTAGKKEDQRNVVEKPGFNPTDQTSTTEIIANAIEGIEKYKWQGRLSIHIHNATSTINNSQQIIPISDGNTLLNFLVKIAPLMVKDSSITAPEFISMVIKEVPLMDKDPSLDLGKFMQVLDKVKSNLPKAA